jgi:thioredoxin reductase (NADPH)
MVRKVTIIGSGPAGYTAAIYSARANLAPLMLTGAGAGGQLMLTTLVENYPGFVDGLMGPELMEAMRKQAERFGTELIAEDATGVDFGRRPFVIRAGDTEYESHAVIIATGASAKLLGLPAESKLMGRGVSTCATCDGFFFRDQDIMVVGGGDAAIEEALYLARLGRKVEVIWDSVVEDIFDVEAGRVTGVRLRHVKTGAVTDKPVDGLFVAIGHQPNTKLFEGQVDLWPNGYVKVAPGTAQTSVPGVFAAGDVQDSVWRQAVTAAGTGCMAALEAERYLEATLAA